MEEHRGHQVPGEGGSERHTDPCEVVASTGPEAATRPHRGDARRHDDGGERQDARDARLGRHLEVEAVRLPCFQALFDAEPARVVDVVGGVVPVAILGTAVFDVTDINIESVNIDGVMPLRWSFEDVGTPFEPYVDKALNSTECTS